MARDVTTLQIELTAEDKASGVIAGVSNAIEKGLVVAAGVAASAMAALTAAFAKGVPAAIEQQEALTRLSNALAEGIVPAAKSTVDALTQQAEALQKTTKFSDDAIEAGQSFAAAFIKNRDALESVTQSAVDLASGLGIDLQTAFELLTKASQGNTATLARYGLVLDDAIPKGEKLAAVQQLIADRFGGRAQADVKTYGGALSQLGNAWGEVLEAIGNAVVKNESIVNGIKSLTAALFAAAPRVEEFAKSIVSLGSTAIPAAVKAFEGFGTFLTTFALTMSLAAEGAIKLGRGILYLGSLVPGLGNSFTGASDALKAMDDAIDPFQQKAARLAGDLGRAALGLQDFGSAGATAAPDVDRLATGVGTLADAADRATPTLSALQVANQSAAESAIEHADAIESLSRALILTGDGFANYLVRINQIKAAAASLTAEFQTDAQKITGATDAMLGPLDKPGDPLPSQMGRSARSNIGDPVNGYYSTTYRGGTVSAFKVGSDFTTNGYLATEYVVLANGRVVPTSTSYVNTQIIGNGNLSGYSAASGGQFIL